MAGIISGNAPEKPWNSTSWPQVSHTVCGYFQSSFWLISCLIWFCYAWYSVAGWWLWICLCRLLVRWKVLPQKEHWYCLALIIHWCSNNWDFAPKHIPQIGQMLSFSFVFCLWSLCSFFLLLEREEDPVYWWLIWRANMNTLGNLLPQPFTVLIATVFSRFLSVASIPVHTIPKLPEKLTHYNTHSILSF